MPVVRVAWFTGRTHKQKAQIAAEITDSIVRNTGTDAKYVYVIFEDVKASDWAGEGNLFGAPSEPRRAVSRKRSPSSSEKKKASK